MPAGNPSLAEPILASMVHSHTNHAEPTGPTRLAGMLPPPPPAPITNPMHNQHHQHHNNNNNNNHNSNHHHHHHQHHNNNNINNNHQQQMPANQMYPVPTSNYTLPLYPSKPGFNAASGGAAAAIMDGHEKETVCIYIPNSMVGAIIGKSGSAIKEMISTSGASIKIAAAIPQAEPQQQQQAHMPKETTESQNSSISQNHQTAPAAVDEHHHDDDDAERGGYEEKVTTQRTVQHQTESELESQTEALKVSRSSGGGSSSSRHQPTLNNPSTSSSSSFVHPSQSHIRKVTIVGTPESQWSAQYMIYRKVALESMDSEVNLMVEIKVPSHLAGKIIGKSGATVKRLQKQTRTIIRLSDDRPTNSSDGEQESQQQQQQHQLQQADTNVQITGDFNSSQMAQRQIRSLIRGSLFPSRNSRSSGYFSDFNMPLQAMNQQPYLFNNIPLSYMPGPNAPNPILASNVNSHTNHAGGGHAIPRAMAGFLQQSHHQLTTGPQMYPSSSAYLPLYQNKPLSGYQTPMQDGEKETTYIYIPNSMVGAIIGKSGSAIKEMICSSGASIKVAAAGLPVVTNGNNNNSAQIVEPSSPTTETTELTSSSSPPNDVAEKTTATASTTTTRSPEEADDFPTQDKELSCNSELESQTEPVKNFTKAKYAPNSAHAGQQIRKVIVVGSPESQSTAQYMIFRKVASERMKSDISLMVELEVPAQSIGKIIGKSGATVKRIQKQTRTMIRLSDDRPNSLDAEQQSQQPQQQLADTYVQITGEFHGSQLAQRQIRNLIRESQFSARQNSSRSSNSQAVKSQSQSQGQAGKLNAQLDSHQDTSDKEQTQDAGDLQDPNKQQVNTNMNNEGEGETVTDLNVVDVVKADGDGGGGGGGSPSCNENNGTVIEVKSTVAVSNNNTIKENLNDQDVENYHDCQETNGEKVAVPTTTAKHKPTIESSSSPSLRNESPIIEPIGSSE